VAELALGLLLAIDRRIADNVGDARAGKWNKKAFAKADGLLGKRIGIVGFGNIGRATAARAKAFGMHVVAWSRSLTDEGAAAAEVERAPNVDSLLASCDVVSLHLAATADTKNLLDARRVGLLQPGCIVINTARADLVDEKALLAAAAEGKIRVGLDVMSDEPSYKEGDFDHPCAATPNVILTHHIGASTTQAQTAIANEAVRIVGHYVSSGEVLNAVNLRQRSKAKAMLVVRHMDKVGVLAGILDELREAGLNVQEMENKLFSGGHPSAAVARIQLAAAPSSATLETIRGHGDEIIHVQAFDIPHDDAG
jgi:D-3-phosphoglycerate dehydrogenase